MTTYLCGLTSEAQYIVRVVWSHEAAAASITPWPTTLWFGEVLRTQLSETILFGSLSSPGDGIVRITLVTQVKKERKEKQTSVRVSNPAPRDWESSTLGTRPLPRTKVFLPILSYVLPAVSGESANLTPANLVPSETMQGSADGSNAKAAYYYSRLTVHMTMSSRKHSQLVRITHISIYTTGTRCQTCCPKQLFCQAFQSRICDLLSGK